MIWIRIPIGIPNLIRIPEKNRESESFQNPPKKAGIQESEFESESKALFLNKLQCHLFH